MSELEFGKCEMCVTTIYHLFPELAEDEDEDERIRKGIIRNLQYLMDRSEGFVKEDLQERIDWLEKQGKQLDPDKVIGWLVANICDFDYYVKRFKQDFGL